MKKLFFVYSLALLSLFIDITSAEAKRKSFCKPGEPKINYIQAIEIAKKTLVTYQVVEETFIDLVKLNCKNQKHTWSIGFRRKSYESGHMLININMDGTSKVSIVKDG